MVGAHYEFSTGTNKENRYFHKDSLDSVVALTDDSGKFVELTTAANPPVLPV